MRLRQVVQLAVLTVTLIAIASMIHAGTRWWWIATIAIPVLILEALIALGAPAPVQVRLRRALGVSDGHGLRVRTKTAPPYRHADLYLACSALARDGGMTSLELDHASTLGELLAADLSPHASREVGTSTSIPVPVDRDREEFMPASALWVRKASEARPPLCLRMHQRGMPPAVVVEIACGDDPDDLALMDAVFARSLAESVFRGKVLSLGAEAGVGMDPYYETGTVYSTTLRFAETDPIAEDDIVLDDEIRDVLHRNVVRLYTDRARLRAHDVPRRRGVLFHGPPGTGKTYACRYLVGQVEGCTVIVVTGTGLLRVKEVFELARGLQPTLVVLEDVDLVFSSRDVNLSGASLGTLMDELDGLRSEDDVSVILTTNAVERVEAAVRDRPGRISQAVFFGPPRAGLRRLYLERYLRARPLAAIDLDGLTTMSSGATQAFLKEWVVRALQIAIERSPDDGELALDMECFEIAMAEMRRYAEGADRIIGFATR